MDERPVRVQGPRSATGADRTPFRRVEQHARSRGRGKRRRRVRPGECPIGIARWRHRWTPLLSREKDHGQRRRNDGWRPCRGVVSVSGHDLGRGVDAEVRARLSDRRAHARVCIGDSRVQERRLQSHGEGCARRVRPGVGVDVRGGNQIVAAEPAGASERSGLFHGLHQPAGANCPSVQGWSTSGTRRRPRFAASSWKPRSSPLRAGGWEDT